MQAEEDCLLNQYSPVSRSSISEKDATLSASEDRSMRPVAPRCAHRSRHNADSGMRKADPILHNILFPIRLQLINMHQSKVFCTTTT